MQINYDHTFNFHDSVIIEPKPSSIQVSDLQPHNQNNFHTGTPPLNAIPMLKSKEVRFNALCRKTQFGRTTVTSFMTNPVLAVQRLWHYKLSLFPEATTKCRGHCWIWTLCATSNNRAVSCPAFVTATTANVSSAYKQAGYVYPYRSNQCEQPSKI